MRYFPFFLFILASFPVLALDCESREGITVSKKICATPENLLLSADCFVRKCEALSPTDRFPASEYGKNNSTARACVRAGAEVIVLKDKDGNEASFCEFKDGSLRDAASMELSLP